MNISRIRVVRSLAVGVLAVGLAGCGAVTPSDPPATLGTSGDCHVTASIAPDDEAAADDDEEDGTRVPAGPPQYPAVPPQYPAVPVTSIREPSDSQDWTLSVPQRDWGRDSLVRRPRPTAPVDCRPHASALSSDTSQ